MFLCYLGLVSGIMQLWNKPEIIPDSRKGVSQGKEWFLWQEEKTAEEGICIQVKARGKTEAICTVIRTDGAGNA